MKPIINITQHNKRKQSQINNSFVPINKYINLIQFNV